MKRVCQFLLVLFGVLISACTTTKPSQPVVAVKNVVLKTTTPLATDERYAFEYCRSLQTKPFDLQSKKKKALIIGDSQGCDFLNSVLETGALSDYQLRFRFIPYACQRIPEEPAEAYISAQHRQFCLQTVRLDSLEKAKQQTQIADLVIFAPLWKPQVAGKLAKIIDYLGIKPAQKLLLIGHKFGGKMYPTRYASMSAQQRRGLTNEVGKASLKINAVLAKSVKQLKRPAIFINPHQLLCKNRTKCAVFTPTLALISYDGRHLTKAGAYYLGQLMFRLSALKHI